ncbi:hypothetical protein GOARA_036_00600 [Gordonia araii NBRC 100433]|uniref:Extradiol ring-cleavage dioxygenase class III enzyme subunit B domain-containing protein n=1 Tax=Gordonia araii NBRC 100433 TaxID=1073574 RepID=G7H0F3_9ACTN|nr:hypothetical protein GOARA_036_00600 [Gordonia araii NBRC 100433]
MISVVFVPGAPALVPEVSGAGAVEVAPVREAVRAAAADQAALTGDWLAVGPDDAGSIASPDAVHPDAGSFGGFGVNRRVALRPGVEAGLVGSLPTSMLLAGWARECVPDADRVTVVPTVLRADSDPDDCERIADELNERLTGSVPVALLVVGDGAIHLSDRAPGGGRESEAVALQARIDAALGSGDPAAVRSLDWGECSRWGVSGRGAWEVAARCAPATAEANVHYRGAPLGVGYNVVTWRFR